MVRVAYAKRRQADTDAKPIRTARTPPRRRAMTYQAAAAGEPACRGSRHEPWCCHRRRLEQAPPRGALRRQPQATAAWRRRGRARPRRPRWASCGCLVSPGAPPRCRAQHPTVDAFGTPEHPANPSTPQRRAASDGTAAPPHRDAPAPALTRGLATRDAPGGLFVRARGRPGRRRVARPGLTAPPA